MIHVDFSRKPVNQKRERILGIWLPAVVLALITVVNVSLFGWYRVRNRDIHMEIDVMEREMKEHRSNSMGLAASLGRSDSREFLQEYRFLRALTNQKSLQWSDLFEKLEAVLPPTVRITVVSPTVKQDRLALAITAEAMTKADQLLFLEAMQNQAQFQDPFVEFEQLDPATRNLKFSMTVEYRGQHGPVD